MAVDAQSRVSSVKKSALKTERVIISSNSGAINIDTRILHDNVPRACLAPFID